MGGILRDSDRSEVPWKNGRGTARDIVRAPPSGEEFLRRVSLAAIAADGPFSPYPGYDRTIVLAEGAGFLLAFDDGTSVRIDPAAPSASFSGDRATDCRLLGGPARALNVMTRRGQARHSVELCSGVSSGVGLLVCLAGGVRCRAGILGRFDAVLLDGPAEIDGSAVLVRFDR